MGALVKMGLTTIGEDGPGNDWRRWVWRRLSKMGLATIGEDGPRDEEDKEDYEDDVASEDEYFMLICLW